MQNDPAYEDVVEEVRTYLARRSNTRNHSGLLTSGSRSTPESASARGRSTTSRSCEASLALRPWAARCSSAPRDKGFHGRLTGKDANRELTTVSVVSSLAALDRGATVARVHDVAPDGRCDQALGRHSRLGRHSMSDSNINDPLYLECRAMADRAKAASRVMATLDGMKKDHWIGCVLRLIPENERSAEILEANRRDVEAAQRVRTAAPRRSIGFGSTRDGWSGWCPACFRSSMIRTLSARLCAPAAGRTGWKFARFASLSAWFS